MAHGANRASAKTLGVRHILSSEGPPVTARQARRKTVCSHIAVPAGTVTIPSQGANHASAIARAASPPNIGQTGPVTCAAGLQCSQRATNVPMAATMNGLVVNRAMAASAASLSGVSALEWVASRLEQSVTKLYLVARRCRLLGQTGVAANGRYSLMRPMRGSG